MTTIAVIPARGGSKRLPRKNILELGGAPILAHSISVAQRAGLFDMVAVSTEDSEIASIARRLGTEVIERPLELARDDATVVQTCLHALGSYPEATEICCIYATAALLRPHTLVASHELLVACPDTDFVMGVSTYEFPPVQALVENDAGYLTYMWPEWRGVQSQLHPRLVVSNGCFYWARTSALLAERSFYGKRLKGYAVPPDEVCDLDTCDDFHRLRQRFAARS